MCFQAFVPFISKLMPSLSGEFGREKPFSLLVMFWKVHCFAKVFLIYLKGFSTIYNH